MNLTPDQFARALALIRATDEEERRIHQLGDLITATEIVAAAHREARERLTNFVLDPDRLADACRLATTGDPALRQTVLWRYHALLKEMIAPVSGPPRQIDFHALSPASRPYLLAAYCKLAVGGLYPHLDLIHSQPPHRLVYVTTSGAADANSWRSILPTANAWLGANYQLTAHTSTTVTLTRRPELPEEIPFNPAWLKPGHLLLGIDVDTQQPFHLALDRMSHLLIAGTPGTGKSVFLHAFLKSCLHSIDQFAHIHLACGQGIAFERYRDLHPKVTVANEAEHLHNLAEDLQAIMKERTARLIAEKRDKMGEYILVLIDEWGAFNTPEGSARAAKDAHATFLQNMMHVGKRGRKVGIRLALVVQEPVERDLATGIRSNLQSIVSFRLPIATHGQSLFGEITPPAVPADVRTLPIGRAIFHDGATSMRRLLQVPITPPPGGGR